MRHRNTELLLGYWAKLRGPRAVPARADVDPRAIKRLLPDLFILDRHGRGKFTFTLAGTRLCWLYGRELRETNFLALWTGASERQVRETLDQALKEACPAALYAIAETADHRTLRTEIVVLPIADSRGNVTRLLCCMTPLDPVMALGERKLTNQWVVSADLMRQGVPQQMTDNLDDDDDDRRGDRKPHQPTKTAPVPYLRLVVSQNGPGNSKDEALDGADMFGRGPAPA